MVSLEFPDPSKQTVRRLESKKVSFIGRLPPPEHGKIGGEIVQSGTPAGTSKRKRVPRKPEPFDLIPNKFEGRRIRRPLMHAVLGVVPLGIVEVFLAEVVLVLEGEPENQEARDQLEALDGSGNFGSNGFTGIS